MVNRVYADRRQLRQAVERLIDQGRVRITAHARLGHADLSEFDKVAIVRYGGGDKPDEDRPPSDGVYLCWLRHPDLGRCRGVYAIEQTPHGDLVVIISAFKE